MKRIREQIEYGDYPERMDPKLERKLKSPESQYAKNPGLRRGSEDVQKLVSSRFRKVVDKLKDATGIQDLSPQHVKMMLMQEMMSQAAIIQRIERPYTTQLEQLAIEASLEETEVPSDWFKIKAYLNRGPIDKADFRMKKEKKLPNPIPSFDIEDLTDEEMLELEMHKRNLINAIVQGSAKKSHYLFQKPEIKAKLDAINPQLYQAYLKVMAINDFFYFTMEDMIESMSESGNGIAGKVSLNSGPDDEEPEDDESDSSSDTTINAFGAFFPILIHEIVKGIKEANARHGYPEDPELAQRVLGQTDVLSHEPEQLRMGPEVVEKLREAMPDEIFDPENKGLINWFEMVLYKIDAKMFLTIMGDLLSGDESKFNKVKNKFRLIMKDAQKMKDDYENFDPNATDGDDGGDDDDDDDFFKNLGIARPK